MAQTQSSDFEKVLNQALRLTPLERIEIIERLAASFQRQGAPDSRAGAGVPFSDEELAELMKVEPSSPEDVVAEGLLGTWHYLGINDGAMWVNAQKRERRERRRW